MVDSAFVDLLKRLSFDEKEARVYLATLELGESTASAIAKKAELGRPIVYYILENLKTRGYILNAPRGKVLHFSAVDPTRLLQSTQTAVEEFRFMLPLIRALQNKGSQKPRIEYHEGKEAILQTLRLFDKRKGARFLSSIQRLSSLFPEEVEQWIRRHETGRSSLKAKAHLLTDTTEDRAWGLRASRAGQPVRILPATSSMDMDFSVVDDILAITSFDPLFIVVIYSESIARSAGALFDLAWEMGTDV